MPYSYATVDSLSGAGKVDVTFAVRDPDWATRANSVGNGSVALRLRGYEGDTFTRDEWRALTAHWARTLVVTWHDEGEVGGDGTAVFAGLISKRDWDGPAGELTLTMVELENELEWRMNTTVTEYDPDGSLDFAGLSPWGMIQAIVAHALNRLPAITEWNYPVDIGPLEAGSQGGSYPNHEFWTLGDLVAKWRDAEGAPDVYLDPEWRAGSLVWVLRNPRTLGDVIELSQSADESPVVSPRLLEDGSLLTTGVFALGKGYGSEMAVGLGPAPSVNAPLVTPYRDRWIAQKLISNRGHLDRLAIADLRAHFGPIRQKSFSVTINDELTPATLRIGARVRVWTDGDEFEPAGWFDGYLIGLKGSAAMRLDLEVQPWA